MALGEAFVEVHADLRPFARDLQRNVRPIVAAFEREINRAVNGAMLGASEENGRRIGDRLSRGMKNSFSQQFKNKNVFIAIASALGSALDDGISALPTEVKAALVAGIALATPIISAMLSGAIVAGIGVGVAGLGILLASQFQDVQNESVEFFRKWRMDFVGLADAFGPAIIEALGTIDARIQRLKPTFEAIFDISSTFVDPLTQGLLNGLERFADALASSVGGMKPFVDELGAGFELLGFAIAEALRILVKTGDDGVRSLRDLIALISAIIVATATLLFIFTKLYGIIRQIVQFLDDFLGVISPALAILGNLFDAIDSRSNQNRSFVNTNTELAGSFEGLIVATDGETKALKAYRDAIEGASEAARSQLELNIAWEESLDRLSESLKENGRSLDISTEKGRNNVREFINSLEIAEKRALERVRTGELTAEQAAAQYAREIEQLRLLARQAGIAEADFNALFNEIISTSSLRISAEEMGVTSLTGDLGAAEQAARELLARLQMIINLSRNIGAGAIGGALTGYADGGIVSLPQVASLAEDGPEVVIPLTKPARAAQLMQDSGLTSMLSSGPTQVLVFVGNEQLESRMVRVVERSTRQQSLALAHGGRSV